MSQYRSFAWISPEGKTEDKPTASAIADLKIKDAAVASLTGKGLRLQKNNPDLLVTYTAKVGLGSKTVYYQRITEQVFILVLVLATAGAIGLIIGDGAGHLLFTMAG